ncbi:MAG: hypothetical protein LBB14_01690 [Puniceicoccales bacterium]|nr:hypothetical protein [Puniceicoccales bacterium]
MSTPSFFKTSKFFYLPQTSAEESGTAQDGNTAVKFCSKIVSDPSNVSIVPNNIKWYLERIHSRFPKFLFWHYSRPGQADNIRQKIFDTLRGIYDTERMRIFRAVATERFPQVDSDVVRYQLCEIFANRNGPIPFEEIVSNPEELEKRLKEAKDFSKSPPEQMYTAGDVDAIVAAIAALKDGATTIDIALTGKPIASDGTRTVQVNDFTRMGLLSLYILAREGLKLHLTGRNGRRRNGPIRLHFRRSDSPSYDWPLRPDWMDKTYDSYSILTYKWIGQEGSFDYYNPKESAEENFYFFCSCYGFQYSSLDREEVGKIGGFLGEACTGVGVDRSIKFSWRGVNSLLVILNDPKCKYNYVIKNVTLFPDGSKEYRIETWPKSSTREQAKLMRRRGSY